MNSVSQLAGRVRAHRRRVREFVRANGDIVSARRVAIIQKNNALGWNAQASARAVRALDLQAEAERVTALATRRNAYAFAWLQLNVVAAVIFAAFLIVRGIR